jgi:copper transport protein
MKVIACQHSVGNNHGSIRRSIFWKFLGWLIAVCLGLIMGASPKSLFAHATLISSEPGDGSALEAAPQMVRLAFSEPIASRFSVVQLYGPQSRPVAVQPIAGNAPQPNELNIQLPPLPTGSYSLLWKVLSEADGHFSQGLVVFGVGEATNPGAGMSAVPSPAPPIGEVILRWFNLAGLLGLVGGLAVLYVVLSPLRLRANAEALLPGWQGVRRRLWVWSTLNVGIVLLAGGGLWLWQVATLQAALVEETPWLSVGWLVIGQTRWGQLWLLRQVLLLGIGALLWWQLRQPASPRVHAGMAGATVVVGLAVLVVHSLSGHAAGDQRNLWLMVVVATLHLLAAGGWIGAMAALCFALWPLLRLGFLPIARLYWPAFTPLAMVCVGLLVASGLYNMGQQVASLDALVTTSYGRLLLGKLGLLVLAGGLGLLNALQLHGGTVAFVQRFGQWMTRAATRMPMLIISEVGLGCLILFITGIMTAISPPRGIEFTIAPDEIPTTMSQTVDDLVVTLAVKPNRPGQNVFQVQSASTRRPPPAETIRLLLRFTHLDEQLGRVSAVAQEVEPGRYLLTGNYLKLAGPWQIEVVTRRHGLEDSVAQFTWLVAPLGETYAVILSKQPLSAPLALTAGLVLIAVALLVVGLGRTWFTQRNDAVYSHTPSAQG